MNYFINTAAQHDFAYRIPYALVLVFLLLLRGRRAMVVLRGRVVVHEVLEPILCEQVHTNKVIIDLRLKVTRPGFNPVTRIGSGWLLCPEANQMKNE